MAPVGAFSEPSNAHEADLCKSSQKRFCHIVVAPEFSVAVRRMLDCLKSSCAREDFCPARSTHGPTGSAGACRESIG